MNDEATNITADAVALQERDEFRAQGWVKVIAPAKVNLHLGIGGRRADGYHDAVTVMHALNLHDVVYLRRKPFDAPERKDPAVRMVSCGDVVAPDVASEDNIAAKAVRRLAAAIGQDDAGLEIRIEKNIPAQGGLGGGSSDAAAALVGAARIWGLEANDARVEEVARTLGSDVAFFLRGGCALHAGTGEVFVRSLAPSKQSVVLVKPAQGVSTAEAYRAFDAAPPSVPAEYAQNAQDVRSADEVLLFNNLAPAAEQLVPALANVRRWLSGQLGEDRVLLCGSGATTFGICPDFAHACSIAAQARQLGYWARTSSFGSLRTLEVSS